MEYDICNLPAILLNKLLTKLDRADVDKLCLVNSSYNACICQNKKLWQSLVKLKFGITTDDNPKNYYFEYSKSLYGYAYKIYARQIGNHVLQKLRPYVRFVSISSFSFSATLAFITSENVLYYTENPFDQQLAAVKIADSVKKVICARRNILFLDFNQNLYVVDRDLNVKKIMINVSNVTRNNSDLSVQMKDGQYLFYGKRRKITIDDKKIKWANVDFMSSELVNADITKLKAEILQNVVDNEILPMLWVVYFKYRQQNYTYTIKQASVTYDKVSVLTFDNNMFKFTLSDDKLKSATRKRSVSFVEYYGDFDRYYYVVNDYSLHINRDIHFEFESKIIKLCSVYDALYILLSNGQVYLYGEIDPKMAIVGTFTYSTLTQPLLLLEGIIDLDVTPGMQLFIAQDMPKIMV